MVAAALQGGVITLDIDPIIEVGPISIAWHGLTTALGLIVGTLVAIRYARARGLDVDALLTVIVGLTIAGFLGARILFLLENDAGALLEPGSWLGSRGFSFYGGMIAGTAAAALLLRRRGLGLRYLDAMAAGFPLGMAVGRIGDLFNGEHYGAPSDIAWAIRYTNPAAEVPSNTIAYHPGGLYEIVLALAIAVVVWCLRDRLRRPGQLLWAVVGLYGAGRFVMFFYRVDSEPLALGLDTSQWVSLGLVAVAALGLRRSASVRRHRIWATALIAALVATAAVSAAGCSDESTDGAPSAPGPIVEDPGPVHAHGIGVDPGDGAIFVATHTGLFRMPAGEGQARRVADRYQDTMAFVVTGPGGFLASGHPDGREELPPYLGLIESTDAGESWTNISLLGRVDFHLLAVAGQQIYGFGSAYRSQAPLLLASADHGRSWSRRRVPDALIGLAISPGDGQRLVASGERGLHLSDDGGRTWRKAHGPDGLLTWPQRGSLYVADSGGTVSVSPDGGRRWRDVGRLAGPPAAFGYGSGQLLAALHDGTIVVSQDGGSSWRKRWSP